MEVMSTIYVVRQKRGDDSHFIISPPESLPPPLVKNKRWLNGIFLLVTYTLGIGSILLGAVHFHNCPANENLPIFLICFGLIVMFARFLNCAYDWRSIHKNEFPANIPRILIWINVLFLLADIASFLLVCVETFAFWPNTDPDAVDMSHYCHKILYWTSFSGCAIGILLFIVSTLGACYACCCYKKPVQQSEGSYGGK